MTGIANAFRLGIFIMMKYPEIGKVKSRLAQSIGDEAASNLYRMFIQDTLTNVESLEIPFHMNVYPPRSTERFIQWLGPSYQFFQQQGTNLGDRLHNGFLTMFKKEYQHVLALASDSPDLPKTILEEAVSSLQTHKVVIGPTFDGGYYLIGFSRNLFIPRAFEEISWSTETVFHETLSRIESVTNQVYVLPKWADIDTKSDLQEFYTKYQSQRPITLHTMKYLSSNPELVRILMS
ncbi:MAG: TIGR04282 family arsenosugar biosynthesis glycosyltransferase [Candidatus Thorarchaeota archaeon]